MALQAADHLKDVIGLRNDIVYNVFSCPECSTEVTISRYQRAGDLDIMCARCNAKWKFEGDQVVDLNDTDKAFNGYKVFIKLDESQRGQEAPDNTPGNADGVTPADIKRKEAAAAAAKAKAAAEAAKKAEEAAPPPAEGGQS